jgi:sarcosine oxidase subunit delta
MSRIRSQVRSASTVSPRAVQSTKRASARTPISNEDRALIIPCPYCGERDLSEFVRRGEVPTRRPDLSAGAEEFVEHLYFRTNPAGPTDEHWYHDAGCRQWMVVRRDTRNHAVEAATFCQSSAA